MKLSYVLSLFFVPFAHLSYGYFVGFYEWKLDSGTTLQLLSDRHIPGTMSTDHAFWFAQKQGQFSLIQNKPAIIIEQQPFSNYFDAEQTLPSIGYTCHHFCDLRKIDVRGTMLEQCCFLFTESCMWQLEKVTQLMTGRTFNSLKAFDQFLVHNPQYWKNLKNIVPFLHEQAPASLTIEQVLQECQTTIEDLYAKAAHVNQTLALQSMFDYLLYCYEKAAQELQAYKHFTVADLFIRLLEKHHSFSSVLQWYYTYLDQLHMSLVDCSFIVHIERLKMDHNRLILVAGDAHVQNINQLLELNSGLDMTTTCTYSKYSGKQPLELAYLSL